MRKPGTGLQAECVWNTHSDEALMSDADAVLSFCVRGPVHRRDSSGVSSLPTDELFRRASDAQHSSAPDVVWRTGCAQIVSARRTPRVERSFLSTRLSGSPNTRFFGSSPLEPSSAPSAAHEPNSRKYTYADTHEQRNTTQQMAGRCVCTVQYSTVYFVFTRSYNHLRSIFSVRSACVVHCKCELYRSCRARTRNLTSAIERRYTAHSRCVCGCVSVCAGVCLNVVCMYVCVFV